MLFWGIVAAMNISEKLKKTVYSYYQYIKNSLEDA